MADGLQGKAASPTHCEKKMLSLLIEIIFVILTSLTSSPESKLYTSSY